MKLERFCGHNPDSVSAATRAERKAEKVIGVVKCAKCGAADKTLYKIDGEYICHDCKGKH